MSAFAMNAAPLGPARKRRGWVAWAPFVVLVVVGALAASGVNLTPQAKAGANNVTVTATVGNEIHMNLCAAGVGLDATVNGGALTPGGGPTAMGPTCTITFGSNNDAAFSNIKVENLNAGNMFCYYGTAGTVRNCATAQMNDEASIAGGGTLTTGMTQASTTVGKFGYSVTAAPTGCTKNASITVTTKAYGVPASGSPDVLCTQTAMGTDGSFIVQWWGLAASNQLATAPTDAYKGVAKYTATAL